MLFNLVKTKILYILGYKKCYFCNKLTKIQQKIPIDAEADHDGDEWRVIPVYNTVYLCQDHYGAYLDGELNNCFF